VEIMRGTLLAAISKPTDSAHALQVSPNPLLVHATFGLARQDTTDRDDLRHVDSARQFVPTQLAAPLPGKTVLLYFLDCGRSGRNPVPVERWLASCNGIPTRTRTGNSC
jgi:hypothetical protein